MATTVRPRPNHYETLGLKPGASNDEIVRAFARQMSMFRPMTDAAHISIAYDVLHNPAKRHAYDEEMGFNRPQEPRQVRFTVTGGAGARFVGSTLPPMPPSVI
jgi:DnaJ-class molecular chaperone